MNDVDELILKTVRSSDKALSAKELEDKLSAEIGERFPRRTLNYRLEKLVSLGSLKPVLSELKQAAYMPMDRYKEWTEAKFQERKIHSDELKREVIKPWIDQLPIISGAVILIPSSMIQLTEYTGEEKLDVEKHDLFGDLEYHLDPDVFDRWDRFKDLVMEYTESARARAALVPRFRKITPARYRRFVSSSLPAISSFNLRKFAGC